MSDTDEAAPATPPETPPVPTITVTFTPDFGIRMASVGVGLTHLWAAAAYLGRLADQAHSDQHMAALAQSIKPSPLIVPRDHLPKRRT